MPHRSAIADLRRQTRPDRGYGFRARSFHSRPGMTASFAEPKQGHPTMRFMMLMIPLGYETAPPDVKLDPERMQAMMKYNQPLKDPALFLPPHCFHPPSPTPP